jgi:hypothetical protein
MLADLIQNRSGSLLRETLSPKAMQDAMAAGAGGTAGPAQAAGSR